MTSILEKPSTYSQIQTPSCSQRVDLDRTSRALKAIRATNRALIRSNSEQELMESICNILVETDGYRLAWVGTVDADTGLTIKAQSGFNKNQDLNKSQISCPDEYLGCSVLGDAVRTGLPHINQNILKKEKCQRCWNDAKTNRYNSTIALPMTCGERVIGVLNIYCDSDTNFDDHEIELLTEMVDDLSYGVVALRTKLERDQALESLKRAHEELEDKVLERTKELNYANGKLKELDQLKSMFIASMSHELRTPLNSIIGFTGIILKGLSGEINEKQSDQLSRVYQSGKHLLSLISDVIDISKLEGHRIEIYPQPHILNDILNEVFDSLEAALAVKDIQLKQEIPNSVFVYTDRKRLYQSMHNLISNAIKYTEEGAITIRVIESADNIKFFVSDTGIGISDKDKAGVFQAFERFDTHLKVRAGGAGIGLYLTKKLVEDILGGKIGFDSELNKGSTFYFSIPRLLKSVESTLVQQKNINAIN